MANKHFLKSIHQFNKNLKLLNFIFLNLVSIINFKLKFFHNCRLYNYKESVYV